MLKVVVVLVDIDNLQLNYFINEYAVPYELKKGAEIFIYPIKVKDFPIYANCKELLEIDKNTINDIDVIQMNYLEMTEDMFESTEDYQNVILYGQELQKWYEQLSDNGQVKIRVNHYPIQANMTQADWDGLGYLDYDLSIAGHYHGGQLRLPFFGALYIPSPTSGIANGYFPKQNEVKGLNQIIDMQQYISAGLGSSASISFLDFRLFNTPEINLITLRCHK